MPVYFQSLVNLIGRVVYRYSNRLGCLVPCESLDEFRETRIHSKAHDGYHVSTFSGWGVTLSVLIHFLLQEMTLNNKDSPRSTRIDIFYSNFAIILSKITLGHSSFSIVQSLLVLVQLFKN